MMPLGPQLMRAFAIGPAAVRGAVSAYAWCAGLSGLLAATYIDRFDRKKLLLAMFVLFTLSNLACALAPNFHVLVLARAFAGLTGGVLGVDRDGDHRRRDSAIAARRGHRHRHDLVQHGGGVRRAGRRDAGRALRLGVRRSFCWCCVAADLALAARVLPALDAPPGQRRAHCADMVPDLMGLFRVQRQREAFLLSGVNMLGSMMVIPFISPMLVGNLGVQPVDMTWVYLCRRRRHAGQFALAGPHGRPLSAPGTSPHGHPVVDRAGCC